MNPDSHIEAEIELLKSRFSDTRALYREVCTLLFFRHGITPTASRLYQYVRKGSMSVPAEALSQFWKELRSRARVEIDHPDLPQELRMAAGQAMAALWGRATQAARDELEALRVDAQSQLRQVEQQLDGARQEGEALRNEVAAIRGDLQRAAVQSRELGDALAQERRDHAATQARSQGLEQHVAQLRQEHDTSRRHFSVELEKGREAVQQATQRAQEAERRALRDMDQERTARVSVTKQLEAARSQLAQAQQTGQVQALEASAQLARLSAELETARHAASQAQRELSGQNAQLQEAHQAAARHQAEAATLRTLLHQGRPAPRPLRRNRRPPGAAGPVQKT